MFVRSVVFDTNKYSVQVHTVPYHYTDMDKELPMCNNEWNGMLCVHALTTVETISYQNENDTETVQKKDR